MSDEFKKNIELIKHWDISDYNKWHSIIKGFNFNYPYLFNNLPSTRKSTSETAIKHLKEAYHDGNLNFVLGAGVSSEFGIPTWENLLQRLLMTTIEHEADKAIVLSKFFSKIFNPSPLIAGRYLEESFKEIK